MLLRGCRRGRVNVKLVVIILAALAVLGTGAFVARHVRRGILAQRDLAAGMAAYDRGDWPAACRHFREYLGRRREDAEILGKYAGCLLALRPVEPQNLARAAGAYRELLNLTPGDAEAYRKLAEYYAYTRNFAELIYIAGRRLEKVPHDIEAAIWLAGGLVGQRRPDEARDLLTKLIDRLAKTPEKHPEYVEACCLLSGIARREDTHAASAEALKWLDAAVEYDPASARALVERARLYGTRAPFGGRTKQAMVQLAQADLESARRAKIDDPQVALALSQEWLRHDRPAESERWLRSVQDVEPAELAKHFLDPNDWVTARFLQAAELAIQRGRQEACAALADRTLEALTARRHRLVVLPQAVRLYLAGRQAAKARRHLDEYLDLRKVMQASRTAVEETSVLQALVAFAEGRTEEVIHLLGPLAERGTSGPTALGILARAYSQTGQPGQSAKTLQAYLRHRPKDADMWLLLARQYLRQGKWPQAARAAGKAESLADDKLNAKLLGIEARVYAAAGRPAADRPKALAALGRELAALHGAHPNDARVRGLQVQIELADNRFEAAEKLLRQAIRQCGEPLELQLQLAGLLAGRGRNREALEVGESACRRHRQSGRPWRSLARLHRSAGRRREARDVLERGLQAVDHAERQDLVRYLATLELLDGDRQAGLKRLGGLAEKDPTDVRTRSLLLNLPEVTKDAPRAGQLLEEIRKIRGANSRLWRQHQAQLWLANEQWRDRPEEKVRTLERWTREDTTWTFPALTLAGLQLRLGHAGQAEEVCRRALAMNPAAVDVAELLVRLLQRQNRHEEAEQLLEAVSASAPSAIPLRLRMALGESDLSGPIEQLTFRAAGNPRDVAARILLAYLVYRQTRDARRAMEHLDEAAEVRPDSLAVAAVRAAILRAEGSGAQALKILDREVDKTGSSAAYLTRARHLEGLGRAQEAEKDYRHLTTLKPRSRGYQLLAAFYRNQGRLNDAVAALDAGLAACGTDEWRLQSQLIHVLLRRRAQGDLARAGRILSEAEQRLGEKPDLLWTRAMLLGASRRGGEPSRREARAVLERLLELEPSHVGAYLALIEIAERTQDYGQAKALCARGLEANPNHTDLLLAHARVERASGGAEGAAALARKVLKNAPGNSRALDILAAVATDSKKQDALSEALKLIRDASAARPRDHSLPLLAARVLQAMGKDPAAVAELVAYAETPAGRRSIPVLVALAGMHRKRGPQGAWEGWIRQAEAIDPRSPLVLSERLRWHAERKEYAALASRTAAYRQTDGADASVMMLAASFLAASASKEHHQEAIRLCERAAALFPDPTDARVAMAGLLCQIGNVDRAEALYRRILQSDPDNQQALNGLAWVLATAREDYKAALRLADKAVKLAPRDSYALDTRGVILSNLPGRLADARNDFEKCLELIPADSPRRAKALLQLGRVCAKLNDSAAARSHLEAARRIDEESHTLTPGQRRELADLIGSP